MLFRSKTKDIANGVLPTIVNEDPYENNSEVMTLIDKKRVSYSKGTPGFTIASKAGVDGADLTIGNNKYKSAVGYQCGFTTIE